MLLTTAWQNRPNAMVRSTAQNKRTIHKRLVFMASASKSHNRIERSDVLPDTGTQDKVSQFSRNLIELWYDNIAVTATVNSLPWPKPR
jgi:hypothetical protein